MMTTYELIRRLAQLDPDGTKQLMLCVKTKREQKEYDANAFIEELWVERPELGGSSIIFLTGVDEE